MTKNNYSYHVSIAFLFLMLLSLNPLITRTDYILPECKTVVPDTVRIVKTNWLNSMRCVFDDPLQPCVELYTDNTLTFVARTRFAQPDVSNVRPMQVRYSYSYDVNGQEVTVDGLTDVINNAMLIPVVLENEVPAYEARFEIDVDLNNNCSAPSTDFRFKVNYQLVAASNDNAPLTGDLSYPVGNYPQLFPPNIFNIPLSGYTFPRNEIKDICCYNDRPYTCILVPFNSTNSTSHSGDLDVSDNEAADFSIATQSPLIYNQEDFSASPNPFDASIRIQYNMAEFGKVIISCLDAQGRIIAQHQYEHSAPGSYDNSIFTSSWPPGLYYLRFQTSRQSKIIKLMRLKE